jgi:Uma2 family endonuclease
LEAYRAIAETSQERYEYCHGEMILMPGGTATHSAIAINISVFLGFLLRDRDFRLYNSDLRLWIPEYNCGPYTDLMIVNHAAILILKTKEDKVLYVNKRTSV